MACKIRFFDDRKLLKILLENLLKALYFTGNHHPRSFTGGNNPCLKETLRKIPNMKVDILHYIED